MTAEPPPRRKGPATASRDRARGADGARRSPDSGSRLRERRPSRSGRVASGGRSSSSSPSSSSSSSGPGAAREAAFAILLRVSEEGAWASRLLESLDQESLDPRDVGLVQEIVLGVLRWRGLLDERIRPLCRRPIRHLDPPVREALRLGAYQILFLDRVPAHAVVNGSVELARRSSGKGGAGLVNAVLRRLAARPGTRPGTETGTRPGTEPGTRPGTGTGTSPETVARTAQDSPRRARTSVKALAAELSHPAWMVERALERFGEDEARDWLRSSNETPPVSLRPNPLHPAYADLASALAEEGVVTIPGSLAEGSLRVLDGKPARTKLFADGAFWFQDEASQIVPLLFPPPWNGLSGDLCAAPGGKTFALATAGGGSSEEDRKGEQGCVVAFDLHPVRLLRLLEMARRIAPGRIAVVAADMAGGEPGPRGASQAETGRRGGRRAVALRTGEIGIRDRPNRIAGDGPPPAGIPVVWETFDRVLLDAPCSGTGVLRRHPEIRWRLLPDRLPELARLQSRLLDTALRLLRPGGHIVYSVCSIEPEEGEGVLDPFLARSGCRPVDPRPYLPAGARTAIGQDGRLRTFPHRHGGDGFFAAVVQKPGPIG